jgi:hypothetical protein
MGEPLLDQEPLQLAAASSLLRTTSFCLTTDWAHGHHDRTDVEAAGRKQVELIEVAIVLIHRVQCHRALQSMQPLNTPVVFWAVGTEAPRARSFESSAAVG